MQKPCCTEFEDEFCEGSVTTFISLYCLFLKRFECFYRKGEAIKNLASLVLNFVVSSLCFFFGVRNITAFEIFGGLYILHDLPYGLECSLINEDMHTSNLVCIINFGSNSTKSNFIICHHIEIGLQKREREERK